MKQPLELSSSVPSTAPKPSLTLGPHCSGNTHHPLGGHRAALTPSHCREQMAVYVHVPTLPAVSLPACCPPLAKSLLCIPSCPRGPPWHNATEAQSHWKTAQHKVKGLIRRNPPVLSSSRSPPQTYPCGSTWLFTASRLTWHEDIPLLRLGHSSAVLRADTDLVTLRQPR